MRSNLVNGVVLVLVIVAAVFLVYAVYDLMGMFDIGADGS